MVLAFAIAFFAPEFRGTKNWLSGASGAYPYIYRESLVAFLVDQKAVFRL